MDVQSAVPVTTGTTGAISPPSDVTEVPQTHAVPVTSASVSATTTEGSNEDSTISKAVAKLYNVSSSSGQPQALSVSFKYVNALQLDAIVFTNPETGEEVAQFPPQELIGLAEFFDQIDGVTLDRKV